MSDLGFLPVVRRLLDQTPPGTAAAAVLRHAGRRRGHARQQVPHRPGCPRGLDDHCIRRHDGSPPVPGACPVEGRRHRVHRGARRPHSAVRPDETRRRPARARTPRSSGHCSRSAARRPQPIPAQQSAPCLPRRHRPGARGHRCRRPWHSRRRCVPWSCTSTHHRTAKTTYTAQGAPHAPARTAWWYCSPRPTRSGRLGACWARPVSGRQYSIPTAQMTLRRSPARVARARRRAEPAENQDSHAVPH